MRLVKRLGMRLLAAAGVADLVHVSGGALAQYGWRRSVREQSAVDAAGQPLPWIAYPAIDLLARRTTRDLRVFEYGCGQSTLWWAARVATLAGVEHDADWFAKVRAKVPPQVRLYQVLLVDGGDYCRTAARAAQDAGGAWDVIVIDGRDRVNCMRHALAALSARGVIVVDNTDRPQYAPGLDFLHEHGFRQLPLRGMAPIIGHLTETSILYRPDNVLGL